VELTFSLGAREKQLGREVLDASNIESHRRELGMKEASEKKEYFWNIFGETEVVS